MPIVCGRASKTFGAQGVKKGGVSGFRGSTLHPKPFETCCLGCWSKGLGLKDLGLGAERLASGL